MYRKVIIMKKVRLLIAMMLVIAALTVGVMAAETDYVGFETETVETGDAITVKVVSKNGFEAAICTFEVAFTADKWTISALSNTSDSVIQEDRVGFVKEGCNVAAGGTILSFTATPVGDAASVVGETFKLTTGTCVTTTDEILFADAMDFDTLTVKAAGPVATEKTEEKAVVVDANDITVGDVTYENVAVLDGSITLPTLEEGESLTTAGIKYDGTSVKTFTGITGGGSITYRALFFGITDDEANALGAKVKTYYTGMFFED